MTDIYINPETGDIDFDNQTLRLTKSNAELTRQRIEISLRTYRGEYVFDINEGVPYLENANNPIQLIGRGSKNDFDSYIKQVILQKPNVDSISNYTSTLDSRSGQLSVEARINGSDDVDVSTEISL